MKRAIKILLGIVAALLVLMIGLAVTLPMIYDTQALKQEIANRVKAKTGRELRIDGKLAFSVFPWLAVEASDLTLGNAPGFGAQNFAHIDQLRAGVRLLPLLHKQLETDQITLTGADLNLDIDAQGKNNWSDFTASQPKQAETSSDEGFVSPKIAGFTLSGGRINLNDQQTGSHYTFSDINLHTGALGTGQPMPVDLSLVLEDPAAGTHRRIRMAALSQFDLDKEMISLDDVELETGPDGKSGSLTVSIAVPHVEANLQAQTLNAQNLELQMGDLKGTGFVQARQLMGDTSVNGTLNFSSFDPHVLFSLLGVEAPATTDPAALQEARLSTGFNGNANHMDLTDVALDLDQSQIRGKATVRNFDHPRLHFDFDIDSIDLDRYLPPAATSGDERGPEVQIPANVLSGLNLDGQVRVGNLKLAGLAMTHASMDVAIKNDRLQLEPVKATLYGGLFTGNVKFNAHGDQPTVSLDEDINGVAFGQLLAGLVDNQNLSGTANGHLTATGQGRTQSELLRSLKGDLHLTLNKGALEGVNVWYELRKGLAKLKGLQAPPEEPDRTVFSEMRFDGGIDNGIVNTRQFAAELPFLRLTGNGAINLAENRYDLKLLAAVRSLPDISADPLASDLSGKQLPLQVSGALDAPGLAVDWQSMVRDKATSVLMDKLGLNDKPDANSDGTKAKSDPKKDAARALLKGLLEKSQQKSPEQNSEDDDGGNG